MSNMHSNHHDILVIISAPSGAGKTTVSHAVIENLANKIPFKKVITYTTRPPRAGEHNDIDYHFISEADFAKKKDANFFIETTTYNGYHYGSSKEIINGLTQGNSYLIATDHSGGISYKKAFAESLLIWLTVSDLEVLRTRMRKRGKQTEEEITQRLKIAQQELLKERAHPVFDHHIENNVFEETVRAVSKVILDYYHQQTATTQR